MKKPTIDRRFWLTTALCVALLAALAADLVLCAVYFAATSWLMKNKLDLE